jgi:hypothetical protein
MPRTESGEPKLASSEIVRARVLHGAAVFLGALLLAWPAFYNGFPLLYPDSMTYLDDGRIVARAIFLHQFSSYYGMRSFFYSLVILPFHWNVSPWPVVGLQSALVAWVLWPVVRSFALRHAVTRYLVVVILLSLLTGVSWYSSFIMPDILGPLVYLSIYLLVFGPETLSRVERFALSAIAVWGVTAHSTHLLLAGGLWLLLVLFAAFERRLFIRRMKSLGMVAALLAVAVASQMALDSYLYGKPSLNGEHLPYLMARIIADGPGRTYLEKHCPQVEWAVCNHLQQLSDNSDDFLWGPDGAYSSASNDDKERMRQQEMPFVLSTLRAYPREELAKAAENFWGQLAAFGIYGFDPSPWILDQFNETLPRSRASYVGSRQARDLLPLDLFTAIQSATVSVSLGVIAASIPFLWRRYSPRLAGLSVVVVSVVANAFVTGVLSTIDDRYGCRVIWLIPLLAAAFLLDWLNRWETAKGSGANARQGEPA